MKIQTLLRGMMVVLIAVVPLAASGQHRLAATEVFADDFECPALAPFVTVGKAVFGVEYDLEPSQFCTQMNAANYSFLKKNWDLDEWRYDCRTYIP